MKNTIFFTLSFIALFVLSSCSYYPYNKIIVENDEYKNEKRIHVSFLIDAKSNKTNLGFFTKSERIVLKFESVTNSESTRYTNLRLNTVINPAEELEKNIFIKTDDEITELQFEKIDNTFFIQRNQSNSTTTKTDVSTKTETTPSTDISIRSDDSNNSNNATKTKQETTVSTSVTNNNNVSEHTLKKVKSILYLDNDILHKINNCNSLQIRIYIEQNPFTVKFTSYKLKKLKEFMQKTLGDV